MSVDNLGWGYLETLMNEWLILLRERDRLVMNHEPWNMRTTKCIHGQEWVLDFIKKVVRRVTKHLTLRQI
jgi:hypothetical protein